MGFLDADGFKRPLGRPAGQTENRRLINNGALKFEAAAEAVLVRNVVVNLAISEVSVLGVWQKREIVVVRSSGIEGLIWKGK